MAITRVKTDSLVAVDLASTSKDVEKTSTEPKKKDSGKPLEKEKKPGFIATTIEELKLVQWPTWRYVYRWSAVILLFTLVVAILLGSFDGLVTNGIRFVDCTSSVGKKQDLPECGKEFWQNLTGTK